MSKFNTLAFLLAATLLVVSGCNGDSTSSAANGTNSLVKTVDGADGTSSDPGDDADGETAETAAPAPPPPREYTAFELPTTPIDAATLMGLMPLTIRGFEMISENARTNYHDRVRYTHAERKFRGEDNQILVYRLVDTHKTNITAWAANPIVHQPDLDEDTDTVFQLVSEISGYPCHIKVLKDRNIAKFQLMIENRVLAELTGVSVTIDDLDPMLRFYDLGLIQEHTKEAIVQSEYKAREKIRARDEARARAGR